MLALGTGLARAGHQHAAHTEPAETNQPSHPHQPSPPSQPTHDCAVHLTLTAGGELVTSSPSPHAMPAPTGWLRPAPPHRPMPVAMLPIQPRGPPAPAPA